MFQHGGAWYTYIYLLSFIKFMYIAYTNVRNFPYDITKLFSSTTIPFASTAVGEDHQDIDIAAPLPDNESVLARISRSCSSSHRGKL